MNFKLATALVAVIGVVALSQPAEAKKNNWNRFGNNGIAAGGCYGPGGTAFQPPGWNNGNAFWKNNNFQNTGWRNGANAGWNNNGWNNRWNNNGWNNNGWNNNGWNNNRWNNNNRFGTNNNVFGRFFNVDQTQQRLSDRIQRGITSGRLTNKEADRLRSMESRINQMEAQYRTDNRLNARERSRLGNELNKLSDRLRREMFDRQMM